MFAWKAPQAGKAPCEMEERFLTEGVVPCLVHRGRPRPPGGVWGLHHGQVTNSGSKCQRQRGQMSNLANEEARRSVNRQWATGRVEANAAPSGRILAAPGVWFRW
jgi:hypothetical protein